MNTYYSEMELVNAFNSREPEALVQVYNTFSNALVFLVKQLTSQTNNEEIAYQAVKYAWTGKKQFTSYKDLKEFLYSQVVEEVINAVKEKPFNMAEIMKIQNEAEAQIVHAEVLRLFALDLQAPQ